MAEVIKSEFTCSYCGTIFSFTQDDIVCESNNYYTIKGIRCPVCNGITRIINQKKG